jgi:hypothetical protein
MFERANVHQELFDRGHVSSDLVEVLLSTLHCQLAKKGLIYSLTRLWKILLVKIRVTDLPISGTARHQNLKIFRDHVLTSKRCSRLKRRLSRLGGRGPSFPYSAGENGGKSFKLFLGTKREWIVYILV